MIKSIYILSLIIFLFVVTGCSEPPSQVKETESVSLDDQFSKYIGQGKWTIVNVWSTSCISCRSEIPDLQDFHIAHKDQDATILGIAIGFPDFDYPDPQTVKDFLRDYFVEFPSLIANAEQASNLVGEYVTMIPVSFFYNPEGNLVGRLQGTTNRQEIEEMMDQFLKNPKPYVSSLQLE